MALMEHTNARHLFDSNCMDAACPETAAQAGLVAISFGSRTMLPGEVTHLSGLAGFGTIFGTIDLE